MKMYFIKKKTGVIKPPPWKRLKYRKDELRKLISVYYSERGWSAAGIPKVDTLKQIGLWNFLNEETKKRITKMNG